MRLPLSYNIRNLIVRRTTTLMTALGIALTVAVLLSVLSLVAGLDRAFRSTGNPANVLVMRQGAESELNSNFSRRQFQDLKPRPGIAQNAAGEPLVSLEMVTVVNLESVDYENGINITLRGLSPAGREMRDGLKLQAGRWPESGRRELAVGKNVAVRNPSAALGKDLRVGKSDWRVVGVFDAGESAYNSEIWADINQAAEDYNRSEVLSSALLRVADPAGVDGYIAALKNDQKLAVNAVTETEYYAKQTSSGAVIQFLGIFVSIVMAVGSCFAAMNTMYAAVARRAREIGTLRVLGFTRGSILASFLFESLLLSALGGVLGFLLVLPLSGYTTGIGSQSTFSEVAFTLAVTPQVAAVGIGFALVMGVLGGLLPAFSAARKEILTALREV